VLGLLPERSEQNWQITGLLGRGTQGNVWNTVMKSDGRQVVIKCLHQHHLSDIHSEDSAKEKTAKLFWTALRSEIGVLEACLGHPNIVQIIGRATDCSKIFLEKADSDLKQELGSDLKQEQEQTRGAKHGAKNQSCVQSFYTLRSDS